MSSSDFNRIGSAATLHRTDSETPLHGRGTAATSSTASLFQGAEPSPREIVLNIVHRHGDEKEGAAGDDATNGSTASVRVNPTTVAVAGDKDAARKPAELEAVSEKPAKVCDFSFSIFSFLFCEKEPQTKPNQDA